MTLTAQKGTFLLGCPRLYKLLFFLMMASRKRVGRNYRQGKWRSGVHEVKARFDTIKIKLKRC